MENRIKEQQMGLFADRLSTESIRGNQFRLYCSSVAYMLMHALRRLALKDTELENAQCTTIRLKLLKIGAQIEVTVRRVWFRLAAGYPYKHSTTCKPSHYVTDDFSCSENLKLPREDYVQKPIRDAAIPENGVRLDKSKSKLLSVSRI